MPRFSETVCGWLNSTPAKKGKCFKAPVGYVIQDVVADAMIPMLAWIAQSAPRDLKATFFAVMASFTNLALSLSQLGTKYLNEIFTVTRQVKGATGAVVVADDYSELGQLLITATVIGLVWFVLWDR